MVECQCWKQHQRQSGEHACDSQVIGTQDQVIGTQDQVALKTIELLVAEFCF